LLISNDNVAKTTWTQITLMVAKIRVSLPHDSPRKRNLNG
jgi:hypothetical protein